MLELKEVFPDMATFPNFLTNYEDGFRGAGLQVIRAEEFRYKIRFGRTWMLPCISIGGNPMDDSRFFYRFTSGRPNGS